MSTRYLMAYTLAISSKSRESLHRSRQTRGFVWRGGAAWSAQATKLLDPTTTVGVRTVGSCCTTSGCVGAAAALPGVTYLRACHYLRVVVPACRIPTATHVH